MYYLYKYITHTHHSNLIITFFEEHQPPTDEKPHRSIWGLRGHISMKIDGINVSYRVDTLRANLPKPYSVFLFKSKDCRGSDVSNPLTLLSECDTPTYFNVETLRRSYD